MEQAIQVSNHQMTAEERAREIEWAYKMARHNEATALRHARDEGKAEGMAEAKAEGMAKGKAEVMVQVAQRMKVMGFSNEQIQTATGLPAESVKRI
jgi:predicted transposase/invertase (TIGR01784 family)